MNKIHGESRLSFAEATSIIVGHGVGSGILAVPFLAAHNSLREILLILLHKRPAECRRHPCKPPKDS